MKILEFYNITYNKTDIDSLLKYLGIKDLNAFTLKEFMNCEKNCLIVNTSMKKE